MKLVLAVDIDGTIYDHQPLYSEAAKEIYGRGYEAKDVSHYDWLKDRYGPDYWQIFNKALHPSWIDKRELYPNVVETLTSLRDDFKIGIHFITYNRQAKLVRKPLKDWLCSHFGDVELSVTATGKKIPIMNRIGAFGIVEDKYATLLEARSAGIEGFGIVQPYNKEELLNDTFDYFEDWYEGEDVLSEALSVHKILTRRKKRLSAA